MENNRIISPTGALEAVCSYVGLRREEMYCIERKYVRDYYEISFCTDWQSYDCYVDAYSAEVAGLSFQPLPPSLSELTLLDCSALERAAG